MKRWLLFWICAVLGFAMALCGLLVPAHLRAVDARVLVLAGSKTPSLADRGMALTREGQLGPAQLLLAAARSESLAGRGELGVAVADLAAAYPELQLLGAPNAQLQPIFAAAAAAPRHNDRTGVVVFAEAPIIELLVRQDTRTNALEYLKASTRSSVQAVLHYRTHTNTLVFAPSESASGQALDSAISLCGLLLEQERVTPEFASAVAAIASGPQANARRLEQLLLDVMSLGQRLNWGQMAALLGRVDDPETLRLLAERFRMAGEDAPVVFAAVVLSGKPAMVTDYLMTLNRTGLRDLGISLRGGEGGVNELLARNQQVYDPSFRREAARIFPLGAFLDFALNWSWKLPWRALALKWILYLAGGFLLAAALHFVRPAVTALERPLQVRGFHLAREMLFALGFLLVVLLLSEPFLSRESQRVEFPFRLRLPTVGGAAAAAASGVHKLTMKRMDQLSLLTLLLFFVLQGLIYTACLVKLAEIRRQKAPPGTKLKLLKNEDHLFDAGLYLGLVGTIISLILVSLNIIQFSLMAAYSSTSFGIIFVSIFKIFNLRPMCRRLLLEAESAAGQGAAPAGQPAMASAL